MSLRPKIISILGDFWDCFVYRNYLYVWGFEGEVLQLDWKKIEGLVQNKYADSNEIQLTKSEIMGCVNRVFDTPFHELHNDIGMFQNKLFTILDDGLYQSKLDEFTGDMITSAENMWTAHLLNFKIKNNGRIALSGGDDGLFEYDLHDNLIGVSEKLEKVDRQVYRLSKAHSLFVNWSFSSVYSSSNKATSFLAGFYWRDGRPTYKGIFSEQEIFGKDHATILSWGSNNRIFRATKSGIQYVSFTQKNLESDGVLSPFSKVTTIDFLPAKGDILYAGVAKFGIVFECEKALVVMKNAKSFYNIWESVTRWRVYPDSIEFHNHLHVVLEDRCSIYVF